MSLRKELCRRRSRGHLHLLPALCVSAVFSGISFTSVAAPGDEQFILQQQRQQALEQQLTPPVPDIRLSPSEHSAGRIVFPAETPCFTLHSVTLTGHNDLPRWLPLQRLANQAVGHCLGTQGIIPE